MTTYLAGLKQFSAETENAIEAVTRDGQKIQFIAPASVTVSRPNKLFAARRGDIVNQEFYYDGKSLTLYNPETRHYATAAAPANVDDMLDFAQAVGHHRPGRGSSRHARLCQADAGRHVRDYLGRRRRRPALPSPRLSRRQRRLADLGPRGRPAAALPLRDHDH